MNTNKIFSGFATMVTTIVAYITGLHITVKVLTLFMVFDFALGMGKAIVNKELTSKKMYKGGVRKCTVFFSHNCFPLFRYNPIVVKRVYFIVSS